MTDGQTEDGRTGATLNAAPIEGRIIIGKFPNKYRECAWAT